MTSYICLISTANPFVCPIVKPKPSIVRTRRDTSMAACQADSVGTSPEQPLRRSANYQPNNWDYNAVQSALDNGVYELKLDKQRVTFEKLKRKVRHRISKETDIVALLELIDHLQRLGVAYHFEKEIEQALSSISITSATAELKQDLYSVALLLRLLRQQGLHVPQDVLVHFKDETGCFMESLGKDAKGMLSLHEASFLVFEGEKTLEEARDFTRKHLTNLLPYMDPYLKAQVSRSLELPLHRRIPRLEARWYIDQYERLENMEPTLLQLAKLDFNFVQSAHQQDLKRMIEWWRRLGLGELSFARDRLTECFFCAMGIVSEPQYGFCREALTKAACFITTIDDVYDVYGSLDELRLFTSAVERWESGGSEGLPAYMKTCYNALYNTTQELADNILRQDGWGSLPFLRKAWTDLIKAFLVEAEWYYKDYKPTLEEHLNNGWISVSGHVLLMLAFLSSKQRITEEALLGLLDYPDIVRASCMVFRLCNDLATSEAERARGDVPTSVECYMREYGVSEEEARKGISCLIKNSWKTLNEGLADCSPLPQPFVHMAINLARLMHCIYLNGDSHSSPDQTKKNQIKSLFFEPVEVEQGELFKQHDAMV